MVQATSRMVVHYPVMQTQNSLESHESKYITTIHKNVTATKLAETNSQERNETSVQREKMFRNPGCKLLPVGSHEERYEFWIRRVLAVSPRGQSHTCLLLCSFLAQSACRAPVKLV